MVVPLAGTAGVTLAMEDACIPCIRLRDLVMQLGVNEDARNGKAFELTALGRESLSNGSLWTAFSREHDRTFLWLGEGIYYFITFDCIVVGYTHIASGYREVLTAHLTGPGVGMDREACQWGRRYVVTIAILAYRSVTRATKTAACDLVLRSWASYGMSISVESTRRGRICPFSGMALTQFLTESKARLKLLECKLREEHCRALVGGDRRESSFSLSNCSFTPAAETILLDGIRRNLGPTELQKCTIQTRLLADTLRGNTSVKTFSPDGCALQPGDLLVLVQALAENLGLVRLDLFQIRMSDETWSAMCTSLANHPQLEHLELRCSTSNVDLIGSDRVPPLDRSKARKNICTRGLLDMLKVNTVVKDIGYPFEACAEEIRPWLEMNKYRPRIAAVKRAELALRASLFVEALAEDAESSANDNLTLIYMMVRGNADLVDEHARPQPRQVRRRTQYEVFLGDGALEDHHCIYR